MTDLIRSLVLLACFVGLPRPAVAARTDGPHVAGIELDVTLAPGRFEARARLSLREVRGRRVSMLLNGDLRVTRAVDGAGRPLEALRWFRNPGARFHKEARPLIFVWPEGDVPEEHEREIVVEYAGDPETGTRGSDWRGILYVGEQHARMSEQTVFYPQIALDPESPRVQRSPATVRVHAPAEWEVYVPGELRERSPGSEPGSSSWTFVSERPTVLSVLAGDYVRRDLDQGGGRVSVLVFAEHESLIPELADVAGRAAAFYAERFGDIDSTTMGLVEIACRDSSYNWASQGVATFDRGALSNGVPHETVAHEVAHLWWGGAARAAGPGERFLTESLAEYSAWRFLRDSRGEQAELEAIEAARGLYEKAIEQGRDTALSEVTFRTPGYSTLAYSKGPLVVRALEGILGTDALDRSLATCVLACGPAGSSLRLEQLEGALAIASGDALCDPWLRAPGHLRVELEDVVADGGSVRGVIRAKAAGGWRAKDAYPLPVELRFDFEGGSEPMRVELESDRTPFEATLPGAPFRVVLDPSGWLAVGSGDEVYLEGVSLLQGEPSSEGELASHGGTRVQLRFDAPIARVDRAEFLRQIDLVDYAQRLRVWDVSVEGERVLLETAPWTPATTYQVPLQGLFFDERGAPVSTPGWSFTTAESDDARSPRVASTSLGEELSDVPVDVGQITIVFDEAMAASRGFSTRLLAELSREGWNYPPVESLRWQPDGERLVCDLGRLAPGTRYVLPFRSTHYRDLSGNRMEDFDLRFTTAADD